MDTVLRVFFVYAFVMFGLRIMGKREFGELAPFDLVVLLLIPEMFSQSLTRDDFSLTTGVVGVSTLLLLMFATTVLTARFKGVARVVSGEPALLVENGRFLVQSLNRERVRPDEVLDAMHLAGIDNLKHVRWAILDTNGKIAIIPTHHVVSQVAET